MIIEFLKKLLPKGLVSRMNTPMFHIYEFLKYASKLVKKAEGLLDAGCGDSPYFDYFKHSNYIGTDFLKVDKKYDKKKLSFVSNLGNLPLVDNSVDTVLLTQVLEHVPNPENYLKELFRVLKKDGKLFLSVPQQQEMHEEPYNFFYFTKPGLGKVLRGAGFEIRFIRPMGGYFHFLSYEIGLISRLIFPQYFKNGFWKAVLFIPYLLSLFIFNFIIGLIVFHLDFLDKNKKCTFGYTCYAVKN